MASSSSNSAIPMISIPEKKPNPVDLYKPIRDFIASHFSNHEAESAEIELDHVRKMRSDLEKSVAFQSVASYEARRDLLVEYSRAISVIKSRLNIKTISFTWQDAFKKNKATQKSMDFEKAAVIFNIGAAHSQIAVMIERGTDEGRKRACVEFQKAAGAFRLVKENIIAKKVVGATTVDLTVECTEMLEKLMLAHAQECYFDKAIADSKSPIICSKIAKQVGIYYEEAYKALDSEPLNKHFDKSWVSPIQLKSAYFYAHACYLYCTELHQKEEIGEEVARLKFGISALSDAKKSARGIPSSFANSITKLESTMTRNLEKAEKENEVYLIRLPSAGSLLELPAAPLVKPASMADALDISNENLFANFIPEFMKNSLDNYNKMVDDVINVELEKMKKASDVAYAKLSEISLTDSIVSVERGFSMPIELKEEVQAIQERNGVVGLELEANRLADLRRVNKELMRQTEELLLKEEREDSRFRVEYGERWTRPLSTVLNQEMKDRLGTFAENLRHASDNDSRIRENLNDLAILDSKPIESALPSFTRPLVSLDGTEDEIVESLKKSMSKLEDLSQQRECLKVKIEETKAADDILPNLLSHTSIADSLFRHEIKKYDPICNEIGENIREQEQLLIHIQEKNDKFAALFNVEEYKVAYEKSLEEITNAIIKFNEIKENITAGVEFYVTLQKTLEKMNQESSDFVMIRNMESHEIAHLLINGSEYHSWRDQH